MKTRTPRTPNTPGFVGYVVAFAFGTVVFFALTVPFTDTHRADALDAVLAFLGYALIAAIYSFGILDLIAFAPVCLILLAMRRVERQWIHAAVAAATAALFGLVLAPGVDRPKDRLILVGALAISMALGRLVVIPAVDHRRAMAALR